MEAITNAAGELLVNFTLAILSLAGAYAVYYIRIGTSKLREQTAQFKAEAGRKALENALDDVERLAALAVNHTEQTAARELRELVKAGTGDREKLLELGRKVFSEVKEEIRPEAQRVITTHMGSFDRYLQQCIEDAVLKVKQNGSFPALLEGAVVESYPAATAPEAAGDPGA